MSRGSLYPWILGACIGYSAASFMERDTCKTKTAKLYADMVECATIVHNAMQAEPHAPATANSELSMKFTAGNTTYRLQCSHQDDGNSRCALAAPTPEAP